MVFNAVIGFSIDNYALMVADTVQIIEDGAVLLTDYTKEPSDVAYIFKEPDAMNVDEPVATRAQKTAVLPSKLRAEVFFF